VILIGENLNIMSKTYGPAIKERKASAIQELVRNEAVAGMDYIDVNIGPARKGGPETMTWLVQTVQEAVDLPLSLDTTNPEAVEAGLKVHRGKALINSISLQPERLEKELPLVTKYGCAMVGLLWGTEGMPRDAAERAALCVDLVYKATQAGVPAEDIWIDPIVTPVCVDINQVKACLEFMSMLSEIAPECKSIVGLSNVSNGTPTRLRPYLNRTYLMMFMKYGLTAAIVDAFDEELVAIARGKRPELVSLVHRMMDGEDVDFSGLTPEEVAYAKTVRVLTGQTVYSHSWLEV